MERDYWAWSTSAILMKLRTEQNDLRLKYFLAKEETQMNRSL